MSFNSKFNLDFPSYQCCLRNNFFEKWFTFNEEKEFITYKYRDEIDVPSLGFVDDLANINECGKDIKILHENTNNAVNERKLQFSESKCKVMDIGKSCSPCEKLFIDKWSFKKHTNANHSIMKDVYEGKVPLERLTHMCT